ncbi:MAG: SDR family oxidoreductase [Planctomycetota bacterium]
MEDADSNSAPLAGRAFVIIGGTTGLGLAGATACLRSGGSVVVTGRSPDSLDKAQNTLASFGRAVGVVGDAQDADHSCEAVARCVESFGRFDGLYHVAGGSGRRFGDGPLHEVTDDGIDATLSLNLGSMIKSNRAAVDAWLNGKSGGATSGSILNMGSVLGSYPSPHHFATHVYAASKAAAIGFTRSCAAYYAGHDIRFNIVAPALVETPMAQRAVGDESIADFVSRKQPLAGGRVGRPDDLDGAVIYLLSDQSRYVTGQVLNVDGGWSVSEGHAAVRVEHHEGGRS